MVIRSVDAGVVIDLAVNAPPDLPASATPAGPTLAPEELAGHRLLALFDGGSRTGLRRRLRPRPPVRQEHPARPCHTDRCGFDTKVLADMIATLDRFTDSEIPVPDESSAADLRAFYAAWRSELAA